MNNSREDLNSSNVLNRKRRLKELMDTTKDIENNMFKQSAEVTLKQMSTVLTLSDEIHSEADVTDRAEHTSEVMRDVQLLKMQHELASKVLQQKSLMGYFSDQIYQKAINENVVKSEGDDWHKFTDIVCSIARTARAKSTMLGAIKVELKERIMKERQTRKNNALAEEKRPEQVDKLSRKDKGANKVNIVHHQLAQIFKANNGQPVPYYKLIIDPANFMKTVENAFQIAFLVRDNQIVIETGPDLYPQVRLTNSSEKNKGVKDTTQAICTLNLQKCRDMLIFYQIEKPMLVIDDEVID